MEKQKPKGPRRWAQDALMVQSACNASGIARSLAALLSELCDIDTRGNHWRDRHPAVVLFVAQLAYLSGAAQIADAGAYSDAYAWCTDVAAGKRADSWDYDSRTSRAA